MARRLVESGVRPEGLVEIPIWSDGAAWNQPGLGAKVRSRRGWSDRFVVMYSGNAGHVHRFDEFLEAAERLEHEAPDTLFAFVGGGPRRAELERRAAALSNVEFHGYVPRSELAASLAAADVHLASLEPRAAGISVPGKLIGILAASRPVVFVGPRACESFETVVESGAGLALEPGGDVTSALLALRESKEDRRRRGEAGRDWYERHHTREVACAAWCRLLEALVEPAPREVPV